MHHSKRPFSIGKCRSFNLKIGSSGNTYTVSGDGVYTANSSGSYSYSEINGTTGAMQIHDSKAGSATIYLAFSTTTTGGYAVKSSSGDGYQIGHFVTTPDIGSLQVSISPPAVVSAGAQWQVDGGALQNSGATVGNLSPGNHKVSFIAINGWMTPADQTVSVSANSTATASGTYVAIIPQTGSLQVTINPANAIAAGAQWQVDDGTLQNSGVTVAGLSLGNHTLSFGVISNWATPADQTISIKAKSVAKAKGTYTFVDQGVYNGLFMQADATEETAGMLKGLTITQKGTYSGSLLINGASHGISGSFSADGQVTNAISRAQSQGGLLTLVMTLLGTSNSAPEVIGTVSGTTNGVSWVATNLMANLSSADSASAEYTMLMLPDTNNEPPAHSPGGDGYALITNKAGTATITGALADGTSFNQTVPVSQQGYVPLYASLYAGRGLLTGWINLDFPNKAGVGLTWIHPTRTTGFTRMGSQIFFPRIKLFYPRGPIPREILTS